jgi:hypothetical protein
MTKPRIVELLTFGLLGYRSCIMLHTSIELRWLLITFLLIHSFTGFSIMLLKIKDKILRYLLEILLLILIFVCLSQFLLLEFL